MRFLESWNYLEYLYNGSRLSNRGIKERMHFTKIHLFVLDFEFMFLIIQVHQF